MCVFNPSSTGCPFGHDLATLHTRPLLSDFGCNGSRWIPHEGLGCPAEGNARYAYPMGPSHSSTAALGTKLELSWGNPRSQNNTLLRIVLRNNLRIFRGARGDLGLWADSTHTSLQFPSREPPLFAEFRAAWFARHALLCAFIGAISSFYAPSSPGSTSCP